MYVSRCLSSSSHNLTNRSKSIKALGGVSLHFEHGKMSKNLFFPDENVIFKIKKLIIVIRNVSWCWVLILYFHFPFINFQTEVFQIKLYLNHQFLFNSITTKFCYRFTYVRWHVCMHVCLYVFFIIVTPFNLKLSNFDKSFVM